MQAWPLPALPLWRRLRVGLMQELMKLTRSRGAVQPSQRMARRKAALLQSTAMLSKSMAMITVLAWA